MQRTIRFVALFCALAVFCCAAAVANAAEKKDKVKAAFALLETIDDQGWTTAHYDGIQYLQEKLGDKVEVGYTENVINPADAERVLRDYAEQGYDVIFATTFGHMDPALQVAKDFPDTTFEHCSGYKTAPNMGTYFGRMYQAEYLAGYMAGLMGYSNVGTVATQPIPEPIRGINAFTLGLTRGLDEAGIKYDPEKINTVTWLKAWRDPINETTLAETLAARGHDLIRQMADTPDSAKAACAAGTPAIGYGVDSAKYGADCALVSTEWNWGPIYVQQVQQVLDGDWKMQEYWGGFEDNAIKISEFNKDVPQDVQDKVNAVKKEFEAGNEAIFTGPIYAQNGTLMVKEGEQASDGDLLTMRWLVKGVSGSIPE
ncbi:BMP family ABC transporter substrate-binding protein [Oceanidesulfovibrio marinus]|uniref:BMP family ABC transporter substrate-binding protein n=1 Tax=Oceanidesulfovibrio marinus TaxID=370038 RepID=A0ABX6NJ83_9BACT|nr:BMP family ABC transporter substrate-binding protein [Oceanidesulfovibrio marinus]QJT10712.1 BMP family ABC transporter substrate-binding protein [Oceanidesulfovibrio marinus]